MAEKVEKCPRCNLFGLDANKVLNAQSRRNADFDICGACATEEAFIDAQAVCPEQLKQMPAHILAREVLFCHKILFHWNFKDFSKGGENV